MGIRHSSQAPCFLGALAMGVLSAMLTACGRMVRIRESSRCKSLGV